MTGADLVEGDLIIVGKGFSATVDDMVVPLLMENA